MENKKKIMVVIAILVIYFVVMVAIFGFDQLKNKFETLEILMAPDSYLRLENGYWKDITDDSQDMLGKTYHIYDNHNYMYDGILQYTDEQWYAFDENNKPLSLSNSFFAYRGNMKVDVANNYQIEEMSTTEIEEAKKLLHEKKISFDPTFTKTVKIEFDLNNDNVKESIYIISNALGMDEQEQYFSIAYLKSKEAIEELIADISNDMYAIPSLNLKEIIDYNNDKKYELIFEKIYFDQIGTCHEILKYEKNIYQSVKACKLIERGDEEE